MLFKILANDNVKIIFWLVVYVCFQVLALCRIEEPVLRLRGNLRRQLPPPSLPIFQQTTPQKQNCPRVLAVGYGFKSLAGVLFIFAFRIPLPFLKSSHTVC